MKLNQSRRYFIKKSSLLAFPILIPGAAVQASKIIKGENTLSKSSLAPVNFYYDGLDFTPDQYINKLQEVSASRSIPGDVYGKGGPTAALEKSFAQLTGKEKAIYLPSGTMANQLALKMLNGNNTKVMVPENSHIFRDEADSAQSVHNLRLGRCVH